jgi:4a-hydroxytetrahydrobiopterin dehydratase
MENWKEENNKLSKIFVFKDFAEAISWMVKASFHIEKLGHHPEWKNIYNKVYFELTTHDAGNTVTEKDITLAKKLDELYNSTNLNPLP